ncbi:unnamed protein product, partial [Didymodactylos carnosus]
IALLITKIEEISDENTYEKINIDQLIIQIRDCNLNEENVEEFTNLLINLQLNQWSMKFKHFKFIKNVNNIIQMDRKNDQTEKFRQTFSNIIYYLYALNNKNELLVEKLLKIFKEKSHF